MKLLPGPCAVEKPSLDMQVALAQRAARGVQATADCRACKGSRVCAFTSCKFL